ncbi:hypothetical protein BDV12DRAFT_202186 [Aspergillus spectabilis]
MEWLLAILSNVFLGIMLWAGWIAGETVNIVSYIRDPALLTRRIRLTSGSPPRPLPRSRRSLSISSSQPTEAGYPSQPNAQTQSSFLVKLPPELRQIIYRHMLVNPTPMHVWRTHRRLCSTPCSYDRDGHYRCTPPLARDRTAARRLPGEAPRRDRCLPLLCSCRTIYSEAIPLLYQANTLIFNDLLAIQSLPRCIIPPRLSSIRSIRVEIEAFVNSEVFPKVQRAWEPACNVLAQLQGLSELTIALGWAQTSSSVQKPDVATFIEPLKRVKASRFIVKVPPNGDPESLVDGVGDVPFTLLPTRSIRRDYRCHTQWLPQSKLLPPPFWPDS